MEHIKLIDVSFMAFVI